MLTCCSDFMSWVYFLSKEDLCEIRTWIRFTYGRSSRMRILGDLSFENLKVSVVECPELDHGDQCETFHESCVLAVLSASR